MNRIFAAALAVSAVAGLSSAAAQVRDAFSDNEAKLAGAVIAAEEPCGLPLDVDGMFAWFDERVPPAEAASFAANVAFYETADGYQLDQMGDTQKRLHCRAMTAKADDAGWLRRE